MKSTFHSLRAEPLEARSFDVLSFKPDSAHSLVTVHACREVEVEENGGRRRKMEGEGREEKGDGEEGIKVKEDVENMKKKM